MPQKSRPFFDVSRNQWILRHNRRKHYLCAGKANEALAWRKAETILGATQDIEPILTITDACAGWLRANGTGWHHWVLATFMAWSAGKSLRDGVHADTLADYLTHLRRDTNYSPSTIQRQINFARTVLRWAHVRGFLETPIPELPKLPPTLAVPRDLSSEQLAALIAAIPTKVRPLPLFMALTGCRPGEARLLTTSELKDGRCELCRGKTWERTGRPRIIYLNDDCKRLLATQPKRGKYIFQSRLGRPYTTSGLLALLKRAGQRIGLSVVPYQLRHTWAQYAIDRIGSDATGEALGHVPGSTETKIYARISQARTCEVVEHLAAPLSVDRALAAPRASARAKHSSRKTARANQRGTGSGRGRRAG